MPQTAPVCRRCNGEKYVSCDACGGSGNEVCPVCNESGSRDGYCCPRCQGPDTSHATGAGGMALSTVRGAAALGVNHGLRLQRLKQDPGVVYVVRGRNMLP